MYPRLEYDRTQLQDNVVDFDIIIISFDRKTNSVITLFFR